MIGERLGGFEVVEEIGRGGMGIVYLARQVSLDRSAALKTIHAGGYTDPAAVERFQIEARAASRITHPNLTQIYDVGVDGDTHFLAMELVEGRSLLDMLAGGPAIDPLRTATIARQVALGLDALHKAGIVHRDVKPGNILVRPDGVAKLTDFGLALLKEGGRRLTQDGQTVGTVDYISPEQVRGEEVDGRSDIYSLGIVMYRMLTGTVPFSGNTAAVLHMQVQETPEDIRLVVPALPEPLAAIVMRCLEKDPEDRFQTAEALAARLEDIQMEMRFLTLHERTMIVPPEAPAARAEAAEQGVLDRAAQSVAALFSPEARRSQALKRTAAQAERTLVGLAQVRERQSELERKVRSAKGTESGPERAETGARMAEERGEYKGQAHEEASDLESELLSVREEALKLQAEYARLQSQRGRLVAEAEQKSARAIRPPGVRVWRRRILFVLGVVLVAGAAVLATRLIPPIREPRWSGPYDVPKRPSGIAAGDLDADGHIDLACVTLQGNTAPILYGDGDGTFKVRDSFAVNVFSYDIVAEDFNRDGLTDLAAVSSSDPVVTMLYGAAKSSVRIARPVPIGKEGPALASGDLNGDGLADLVAGDLSLLLGTEAGGFRPPVDCGLTSPVQSAATGDVNGDGHTDIAVTLKTANAVGILYGDPGTSFARRREFPVREMPDSVAAADIDLDGVVDLAVTSQQAGDVTVFWMEEAPDPERHRPAQHRVATELQSPTCIGIADIDCNGLPDLVVVDEGAAQLVIALQTEARQFSPMTFPLPLHPFRMAVADLDGNGYPDVAITHGLEEGGQVSVLLNPGYDAD